MHRIFLVLKGTLNRIFMALQTARICCATIGSSLRNNVTIVAQQLLRPCATILRVWQVPISLGLQSVEKTII